MTRTDTHTRLLRVDVPHCTADFFLCRYAATYAASTRRFCYDIPEFQVKGSIFFRGDVGALAWLHWLHWEIDPSIFYLSSGVG